MLELLVVILIAVICIGIYGYTYYIYKYGSPIKAKSTIPKIPSCPKCPDCFVKCPICPEKKCPKCPECGKTPPMDCPKCPEQIPCEKQNILGLKFSSKLKHKDIKIQFSKLVEKFNKVEAILISNDLCTSKDKVIDVFINQLDSASEKLYELPCDEFFKAFKEEIHNEFPVTNDSKNIELAELYIDIIDIISGPNQEFVCVNNKINKTKLRQLFENIIGSLCDGANELLKSTTNAKINKDSVSKNEIMINNQNKAECKMLCKMCRTRKYENCNERFGDNCSKCDELNSYA